MFGQGLSGEELTELIERDLGLRVAFPCFPLESPLGHTACCIVSLFSWWYGMGIRVDSGVFGPLAVGLQSYNPGFLSLRMHPLT